jgi:hypothetical protein
VRISFPSFASTAGLSLHGTAVPAGSALRLTAANGSAGSAWSTTTIDPTKGFSTSFRFTIAEITDGLAFVIQSQGPAALGSFGSGLGYGARSSDTTAARIRPSVAVEFDTWDNAPDGFDPAGHQHVAIVTGGDVDIHRYWADPGFSMYGAAVGVWLEYNAAGSLAVYVSQGTARPANPLFTAAVSLASLVGTGRAYVGFTGGTGDITSTQDVTTWEFAASS